MLGTNSAKTGERRRSSLKGWRRWLYAFGPWGIGGALVLFTVLVVAYENRYRRAVKHEIETRLVARQEALALVCGQRLRDYLADVGAKLDLMSQVLAASGMEAAPRGTLEQIARHDVERNWVTGLYVVDSDFKGDDLPRYVIPIDDKMVSATADGRAFSEQAATEYAELVGHLAYYRENREVRWHISEVLKLNVGGHGQVLTAPVVGADGRAVGLVAALLPTAFQIDQIERSAAMSDYGLWILTADGQLLGDHSGPEPDPQEVSRVAAGGGLTTRVADGWVMSISPVVHGGTRPWTLVAAQPTYEFQRTVEDRVGGPWTRRMLVTVACGNFLGLVVLLTLRHWREQITVLRSQAEHDSLTDAYSRRFLDREATLLCRRIGKLGIMMIDLNEFKRHNDTLGHYIGDEMLKATAELLRSVMREQDFVVRFGGDEFLVLLPLADQEMVNTVEARIREAVEMWNLDNPLPGARLSLAIGSTAGRSRELDQLIQQADERMYADKARFKGASVASASA